MAEPIITVSGLRGTVGETLTPEVAARYATAFAAEAPPGEILVARDSRPSGETLARVVHAALQSAGRKTIDAGIAATPTVGVLLRSRKAAGAVQITASHNPPQYNGMKLFSDQGRVLSAGPGQKVLERYRHCATAGLSSSAAEESISRIDNIPCCDDTTNDHLRAVLDTVDVERIRNRRFRVLMDSNHGAGGVLGRRLLEELGCRATVLCQDPDADRLAVIDAASRCLGEEYTLAICAEHVLRQRRLSQFSRRREFCQAERFEHREKGTVPLAAGIVSNCASSRMSQDVATRHGVPFFRSAVGEAYVADAMIEHGAVFGGEGNGGPIDPRVGYVRDSFVGMALLLDAMAAREMSIAQLADELPRYEIVKTKMPFPTKKLPALLDLLEKHFPDAAADRLDGLRLDWPDRWLLVRGSNTEPIVRTFAEAPTAAEASRLCGEVLELISR